MIAEDTLRHQCLELLRLNKLLQACRGKIESEIAYQPGFEHAQSFHQLLQE